MTFCRFWLTGGCCHWYYSVLRASIGGICRDLAPMEGKLMAHDDEKLRFQRAGRARRRDWLKYHRSAGATQTRSSLAARADILEAALTRHAERWQTMFAKATSPPSSSRAVPTSAGAVRGEPATHDHI